MKKAGKYICKFLLLVIVLLCAYSALSIYVYSHVNELHKTDAAIVLGAAAWGREPSPVFRERINHAIWLYEQEYVDRIIFTGGKKIEEDLSEAEVGRLYALKNNIPENAILMETESMNTEENIRYAYEVGSRQNLKTYTIVSDPLHMKRAMMIARHHGIEAYSSPTSTSAFETMETKIPFYIKEVIYTSGYFIRYTLETIYEFIIEGESIFSQIGSASSL